MKLKVHLLKLEKLICSSWKSSSTEVEKKAKKEVLTRGVRTTCNRSSLTTKRRPRPLGGSGADAITVVIKKQEVLA
jgi:hypothetical protein